MSVPRSTPKPGPPPEPPSASAGEVRSLRSRFSALITDQVEQAALSLFADRGYSSVTVAEIAAATGISPRTFFRYFGSKEELLLRDQQRRLERLRTALLAEPADLDPVAALHDALVTIARSDDTNLRDVVVRSSILASVPGLIGLWEIGAWAEPIVNIVADRLAVDPAVDPRPAVLVMASISAVAVGYGMWSQASQGGPISPHVDRALRALRSPLMLPEDAPTSLPDKA